MIVFCLRIWTNFQTAQGVSPEASRHLAPSPQTNQALFSAGKDSLKKKKNEKDNTSQVCPRIGEEVGNASP